MPDIYIDRSALHKTKLSILTLTKVHSTITLLPSLVSRFAIRLCLNTRAARKYSLGVLITAELHN